MTIPIVNVRRWLQIVQQMWRISWPTCDDIYWTSMRRTCLFPHSSSYRSGQTTGFSALPSSLEFICTRVSPRSKIQNKMPPGQKCHISPNLPSLAYMWLRIRPGWTRIGWMSAILWTSIPCFLSKSLMWLFSARTVTVKKSIQCAFLCDPCLLTRIHASWPDFFLGLWYTL